MQFVTVDQQVLCRAFFFFFVGPFLTLCPRRGRRVVASFRLGILSFITSEALKKNTHTQQERVVSQTGPQGSPDGPTQARAQMQTVWGSLRTSLRAHLLF